MVTFKRPIVLNVTCLSANNQSRPSGKEHKESHNSGTIMAGRYEPTRLTPVLERDAPKRDQLTLNLDLIHLVIYPEVKN